MLLNEYFKIADRSIINDDLYSYKIEMLSDSKIYEGHFPGMPVSPGVCNISVINQCASDVVKKPLRVVKVSRCRFLEVISPGKNEHLTIDFQLTKSGEHYTIAAKISDGATTHVDFKGELA